MPVAIPKTVAEVWLSRESLELKWMINIARGANIEEWPPPEPFRGLFRDLKDAIRRGELPAGRNDRQLFDSVRLLDLWRHVSDPMRANEVRWEPIRALCRQWARQRGIELDDAPSPPPAPCFSGNAVADDPDNSVMSETTKLVAESQENPSARPITKAELEARYIERLQQHREQTGQPPKRAEDEKWGRQQGVARPRVRDLRAKHFTEAEKKGGHPKRR